jgi:hypothetical protein
MKQAKKLGAGGITSTAAKAKIPAGKNRRGPQPMGISGATGKLACRYLWQ